MPYRFHVTALPHTHTNPEYCVCAYTMKVWNFCRMMMSLGHEVYHYGGDESQVECTEHVPIISKAEQELLIGKHDHRIEPCSINWDPKEPYWQLLNARTAVEVLKRHRWNDFLCVIGGDCHKPVSDMVGDRLVSVEYGVGYKGVYAPYRVFESYAHMHRIMSVFHHDPDCRWYDAVIPNYFDPDMFPFCEEKEDYLLYVGRVIKRKGIEIAARTAAGAGMRLLVGGTGVKEYSPGRILADDGSEMKCRGLTYVGVLDVARRAALMSRAKGVIMPTTYIEPFGGVAVEAMFCGTPVITPDFGAFTETIEHGKTGWRCHNLDQFVWAARHLDGFDLKYIRDRAVALYSLWNVRHRYQEYFDMLSRLTTSKDGWYSVDPERKQLGWLSQPSLGSGYEP